MGDLGLWMSYLQFAREAKALKKFKTVLTAAIRLHPTKTELWLYAAKWTLEEESDMNGARSYMQRGTRFCTRSKELWIEYAKLEMIYLAKIGMRRKILGLDRTAKPTVGAITDVEQEDTDFTSGADLIAIPDTANDMLQPTSMLAVKVDEEAVQDPMTTPALMGAIPIAIFNEARKQPFYCAAVAEEFFNMFATFTGVHCQARVVQHVVDTMTESFPTDPATCNCLVRQPMVNVEPLSVEFPPALGSALEALNILMETTSDKASLSKKTTLWIEPILALEGLDSGIKTVLRQTIRKLL